MATREGNWWSRAWGTVAVSAFAVHLGAAVYEAIVIAPLWSASPPKSVVAWASMPVRPDSSLLFDPLVAVIVVATLLAWTSGLGTRGWRRWWLTLTLGAAAALAAITVVLVIPCERQLFGAAALGDARGDGNTAVLLALTGDWMRAAVFRAIALLVGAWAAYRAQLAGLLGDLPVGAGRRSESPAADSGYTLGRGAAKPRRSREFDFGDAGDDGMTLGDDASNPRARWQTSLPHRRRTAKK